MKYEITDSTLLKVSITKEERLEAKKLAKAQGMTLQGWLGQLIKTELHKGEAAS